jgi:hypothetical protein
MNIQPVLAAEPTSSLREQNWLQMQARLLLAVSSPPDNPSRHNRECPVLQRSTQPWPVQGAGASSCTLEGYQGAEVGAWGGRVVVDGEGWRGSVGVDGEG